MQEPTETEALAAYVETRSDSAFERIVAQHIGMVFGCAMRRCDDRELSEEISQNVFAILAKKAHRLKPGAGLAGWLHKTTLYETKKALRGESRRNRKMKALAEHEQTRDHSSSEMLPQLDEAIDELPDADRHLLLMRFFEGKNFREIAQATGKSEAASQKQASRAIEKLGRVLKRRGIVASTTAMGTILAAESAKAVPASLVTSVSSGAFTGAATLSTTTLITNAIQTMTYAKTKIAIFTATAAALPIGAQWNAIGNLKEEAETFREREVEFVQRSERLTKLEKQIESLPEGFFAAYNTNKVGKQAPIEKTKLSALSTLTKNGTKLASPKESSPDTAQGDEEAETNPLDNATGNLNDMMKNPVMRAMIKKQMIARLDVSHGDFIRYVTDDEDKQAQIKQILLDRMLDMSDVGSKLVAGSMGEDRDNAIDEITASKENYDAQLKAIMGEEGWDEFERFEGSTAERQELSSFRETLEESGLELKFETEQQLMTIMFEENESHDSTPLLDTADLDLNASNFSASGKNMEKYFQSQRELQLKVLGRAENILSPSQLKIFEKNQQSYLSMVQSTMEMSNRVRPALQPEK